ncbi:MAG: 4-(cytidine 5'-diphospho)-2-C-methyl-D-erythritol kinase [Ignavibacteriae bacterium]|nr:4-(cytidine 5'-diphospho)-2-C-methyl-D-erythritol kinase [Ignavibacteriota bacterium]
MAEPCPYKDPIYRVSVASPDFQLTRVFGIIAETLHSLMTFGTTNVARAYAKINLGLRVLEKRPDGFHNIVTAFHRIDTFDEIELTAADEISVVSSSFDAPSDETNICHKAARLLAARLNMDTGVRISITKRIPVGAGLGGGSSDAAIVLRELPAFWKKTIPESELRSLALQLGSDVPFFLGTKSAVGRGRGELLEFFDLDIPYAIVVCNPNIHVSTAWAYKHVTPTSSDQQIDLHTTLLTGMKDPTILTERLKNDFEEPVFKEFPEVGQLKSLLLRDGAVFASMSGSGSSVYGFFDNSDAAMALRHKLDRKSYRTFMTQPHFAL